MIDVAVLGVGACAPGMLDWQAMRAVLRGEVAWHDEPLPKLDIPQLPVAERRRVSPAARLAMTAAGQAVAPCPAEARAAIASVFATADGDGAILAATLQTLQGDPTAMSPTLFHNSVFNAAAGYWTIAGQSRARSTTVCAGAGSFAAGLLETVAQVHATMTPVLLVAVDLPFPPSLASFEVNGAPFACALLLAPATTIHARRHGAMRVALRDADAAMTQGGVEDDLAAVLIDNPAARGLPLLAAIARGRQATVALPYVDGCAIEIAYMP